MADREHVLTFELIADNWAAAEKQAAKIVRTYTVQRDRGRYAVSDDEVLRDAHFRASPVDESGNWKVAVEVTV